MTAKRRHPRQSQGDSTHMLDEALFNAVNVLARPPELVLEVVESSVSAMLLVDLLFYVYAHGGRGAEKRPCSAATGTRLSFLVSIVHCSDKRKKKSRDTGTRSLTC